MITCLPTKEKTRERLCQNDSLYSKEEMERYGLQPLLLEHDEVKNVDVVIVQAYHQAYE